MVTEALFSLSTVVRASWVERLEAGAGVLIRRRCNANISRQSFHCFSLALLHLGKRLDFGVFPTGG